MASSSRHSCPYRDPALWIFLMCYIGFAVLTWAVLCGDRSLARE